jgi:heme o synthase
MVAGLIQLAAKGKTMRLISAWSDYWQLTKPRVVSLIVFTALIGMVLADPALQQAWVILWACVGIAAVAGAAAAINCLIEQHIDARMARTRARPLPRGEITSRSTLVFALLLGGAGLGLLAWQVNVLTMALTAATFLAYAVVYTAWLKPATPQNIVIGGASGAMPPVLGWVAISNHVAPEALVLFLLIFVWTPPHFWALALYRRAEYAKAGLPMLPVTHGELFTRLNVLLYTVLLVATTFLPLALNMSGAVYWLLASVLNCIYLAYAWRLWRTYSDQLARSAFRWSIFYLSALFAALVLDRYAFWPLGELL